MSIRSIVAGVLTCFCGASANVEAAAEETVEVYSVVELSFRGPVQRPHDTPSRDIEFWGRFRHEAGQAVHKVYGFWDGDGQGGNTGDVFKIRFCPTLPGRWTLTQVHSSAKELAGQRQGEQIVAVAGQRRGFWLVDEQSPGRRWYRRSDGSHQYIVGNTMYSFLSGYRGGGQPTKTTIAEDVLANAQYFKKLRFGLHGDYYPHPAVKPYLDDEGRPTDAGDYSHRPNPHWFHRRVDKGVQAAAEADLIADLIFAGPDTELSRSTLRAQHNRGDATPFLQNLAARYGSYPNVWICLANEYEIRTPRYSEEQIARFGQTLREFLPYPTPVSNHNTPRTGWSPRFDELPPWHDHHIVQKKLKQLGPAADAIQETWLPRGGTPRNKPTLNDELSYQGAGDKHLEQDTIESHLGAFLGGGYGSTGYKPGAKVGQYFWGQFDASEHSAADNLKWLRETIDEHIAFWNMAPDTSIFPGLSSSFRALAWPEHEYVLGTNQRATIVAELPEGTWTVTQFDIVAKSSNTLSDTARGRFEFTSPDSRAALIQFKRIAPF